MDEREREALKARIQRERGFWSPMHESLFQFDPTALEAYFNYVSAATTHLSHKLKHLILMAADASVTHLFQFGIDLHMELAMKAGATREEVFAVLQLLLELCSLSSKVGFPILAEEAERMGLKPPAPAGEAQAAALFQARMGYVPAWLQSLEKFNPAYARELVQFMLKPWKEGVLDDKTRSLVMVAAYSAPTTLHEPSLREYIRLALQHGATTDEIGDVMQTVTLICFHTYSVAAPILAGKADVRPAH